MSLIKEIKQYVNGSWQTFALGGVNTDTDAPDMSEYAKKTDIDDMETKIKDGDIIAGKAASDQNGNIIDSTYAKKIDISDMETKSNASSTYLSKIDAASTYVKKTDLPTNVPDMSTYATKTDISDMETKTNAASTYATKTEISDMETKTHVAATYVKKSDLNRPTATFGDTTVIADSINDLLIILSDGFKNEIYSVPNDKTITYSIYGYNEMGRQVIANEADDGKINKVVDFSIDGTFKNINLLGYHSAQLKYIKNITTGQSVANETIGPQLIFANLDGTQNVNVSISNISFYNDTPKATAWQACYFQFHVGYDGTLSLNNCSFLENGLMLVYGVTNSIVNCKFNSINSSRYALWIGKNAFGTYLLDTLQNVTIDNCIFNGYRSIKILTDTKTTSSLIDPIEDENGNQIRIVRDTQSIIIKNCTFQDITAKPAILLDSVLKYPGNVKYLQSSSFDTGESKLIIDNNNFTNCPEGDIIIDENIQLNGEIKYTINNEVRKAYNIVETNTEGKSIYVCTTETIKSIAFQDNSNNFSDEEIIIWSAEFEKFVSSGLKISELPKQDGDTSIVLPDMSLYATKTDISDMETKTNAASTYLSKTSAANIYLSKTEANNTYVKKGENSNYALTVKVGGSDIIYDGSEAKTADVDAAIKAAINTNPEQTDYTVSIEEDTTDSTIAKRYIFKQLGEEIGRIDLAKELVVTSGSVNEVTEKDKPYDGAKVGDKYIELVIANQDAPIYVPAKDLVDIYTAEAGAAEVQVAISSDNKISATLVDGGIIETKLAKDVKTKLNKTWEEEGTAQSLVNGLANSQVKTNKEAIDKLNSADTVEGSVAKSIKDAIEGVNLDQYAKTDNLGDLATLDTITANKVTGFTTEVAKVKVTNAFSADEATKAQQDGNGMIIADHYLPKSGGTLNGTLKFNSTSLPQKTLGFVCGIDSFDDGGEMGWSSTEALTVGSAIKAAQDGSGRIITETYATKGELNEAIVGKTDYLGTVTSLTELSTTCGKGDFYRVQTQFDFGTEKAHIGDILIALVDNPAQNILDWDLIHTEVDSDTWVANSATASGYVLKGEGQVNKIWMTDANGIPAWRDGSDLEIIKAIQIELDDKVSNTQLNELRNEINTTYVQTDTFTTEQTYVRQQLQTVSTSYDGLSVILKELQDKDVQLQDEIDTLNNEMLDRQDEYIYLDERVTNLEELTPETSSMVDSVIMMSNEIQDLYTSQDILETRINDLENDTISNLDNRLASVEAAVERILEHLNMSM